MSLQVYDFVRVDGVPYEKLRPTYTHEALQKLMSAGYLKYIISQNGDGLHGLSGIPDENISELHGNVFNEVCEKCDKRYNRKFYVMDDIGSQYFEEMEDFGISDVKKPKYALKCERCGLSHRTGRKCETKVYITLFQYLMNVFRHDVGCNQLIQVSPVFKKMLVIYTFKIF